MNETGTDDERWALVIGACKKCEFSEHFLAHVRRKRRSDGLYVITIFGKTGGHCGRTLLRFWFWPYRHASTAQRQLRLLPL